MKNRKNKFLALGLGVVLGLSCVFSSYATSADLKDAKKKVSSLQEEKKKVQDTLKQLEGLKSDAAAYVKELDKKLTSLDSELSQLEKDISAKEDQIENTKAELEEAKAVEKEQYASMKLRIQYMYENGNQEYLDIIFGAKSISDLLNRSEYVEKISEYDNKVFAHFKKAALTVQQKEKQCEQQTNELKELETKTREEKQAVSELKADKKTELDKIDKAMEKSQDQVSEYTKKALEAENQVEALLQKKQDEIDREMAAGGGNSGGSTTGFGWPLKGGAGRISSGFGGRKSPTAGASTYHKGVDLAAPSGTPILAAGSGKVVTATYSSSAGNYIMISHGNRLYTVYMHCSRLAVSAGKQVTKGQVIGYVGSTGISTGAHLHFGVTKNGSYVNPLNYISR